MTENTGRKRIPKSLKIYDPAPASIQDVAALQAVYEGRAQPHQQKRALEWIINNASNAYGNQYRPGTGSRDTDFGLGRAFVGQQVVTLLKINLIEKTGE